MARLYAVLGVSGSRQVGAARRGHGGRLSRSSGPGRKPRSRPAKSSNTVLSASGMPADMASTLSGTGCMSSAHQRSAASGDLPVQAANESISSVADQTPLTRRHLSTSSESIRSSAICCSGRSRSSSRSSWPFGTSATVMSSSSIQCRSVWLPHGRLLSWPPY